jgi:hypothetical protein
MNDRLGVMVADSRCAPPIGQFLSGTESVCPTWAKAAGSIARIANFIPCSAIHAESFSHGFEQVKHDPYAADRRGMATPPTTAKAWAAAAMIGALVGGLCFVILKAHHSVKPEVKAGDFQRALSDSRDLLTDQDPYRYPAGPYAIPYPLPAALLAMPLSRFPDILAASLFFGASTMLLAFGIVRAQEEWRLAMLLSWSFIYALLWVQWTPLIGALWFLPGVAVVMLVKPHIALPVLLAGEFRRRLLRKEWKWLIAPVLLLLFSLIIYPTWPLVWQRQLATYQGIWPPLFAMPLGPLVLLSLVNWRDRRAWLIVILALMPQRMVYDQLPLMLVAENRKQLWILIVASWINCAIFFRSDGWGGVPMGWQNFIIATLYLPAVAIVMWSRLRGVQWITRGRIINA